MVTQKLGEDEQRARRVVEAAEKKRENAAKKWVLEAAKKLGNGEGRGFLIL
jgi:hypothetical protein